MPNIPAPTGPMPQGIRNLVERASGLLDPDPRFGAEVVNSLTPRPTFGQRISEIGDFFAPSNITRGIYDIGTGLIKSGVDFAYDPYGTLRKGIGSIGGYLRGELDNILSGANAAMLGPGYGDPDAIGRGFVASLDIPLAGSAFGTLPADSLGSLIARRTAIPDIERAMDFGDEFVKKYGVLTSDMERELFEQTAKMTPEWASGYQDLIPGTGNYGIEALDDFRYSRGVDAGIFEQSMKPLTLGQITEWGPTIQAYPQFKDMPVRLDPSKVNTPNVGVYYSAGYPQYYPRYEGALGFGRYAKDQVFGAPLGSSGPAVEVNIPFGTWSPDNEYVKALAHEVGGHAAAKEGGLPWHGASTPDIMRFLEPKYPGIDKNKLYEISYNLYRGGPAEAIAWNVENRIGVPESYAKSWDNRFSTSYTPDDIRTIISADKLRESIRGYTGEQIP